MVNPKNILITQKFNFFFVVLILGFVAIASIYSIQVVSVHHSHQERTYISESDRLLSRTRLDLLKLNQLLLERFSFNTEATIDRQFQVRASLTGNLLALKARTDDPLMLTGYKDIERQLGKFDTVHQQLLIQHEIIGENAKDGLLLELAVIAEQFEATLLEVRGQHIKPLVLDLRREEKNLVEHPGADTLELIDGKLTELRELLSGMQISQGKLSSIDAVLEEYSLALMQFVSVTEGISQLESELVNMGESLSSSASGVQVIHDELAVVSIASIEQSSSGLNKLFVGVIIVVLLMLFVVVYFLKQTVSKSIEVFGDTFAQLNDGDLESRVALDSNNEFGLLANSLNTFLDDSVEPLRGEAKALLSLHRDIDAFAGIVESLADEKKLTCLPVSSGKLGAVAKAINSVNFVFHRMFFNIKQTSFQVDSTISNLQDLSLRFERIKNDEHRQVVGTSKALTILTKAMGEIALKAESSHTKIVHFNSRSRDIKAAGQSLGQGMTTIKSNLPLAEAHLDALLGLSDRFQGVINIVNNIADRSHIFALNASMSVEMKDELTVVDEMQELAQHARTASREVVSVVESTLLDLDKAVSGISHLVEEVVVGVNLGEYASTCMAGTDVAVKQLDGDLRMIADSTTKQAALMSKVCERADSIRMYVEKTTAELKLQDKYTHKLKHHADTFLSQVNMFGMPEKWNKIEKTSSYDSGDPLTLDDAPDTSGLVASQDKASVNEQQKEREEEQVV